MRKANTPVKEKEEEGKGKRKKKPSRAGIEGRGGPDVAVERNRSDPSDRSDPSSCATGRTGTAPPRQKKISRRDDARFQSRQPRPTSDGFSNADLAIKTHCQRQRLPHPSD